MEKIPFFTENKRKKPKHFGRKLLIVLLCLLLVAATVTVAVNVALNRDFTVSFYQLRNEKVSDNIRIVELADLHNSQYGEGNCKLVEKIKSLKPDLIVYAGDMMNEGDNDYSVLFDLTDNLIHIAPVYACYGNNELDQVLFYDKTFADQLTSHGVKLLSNEAEDVVVKKTTLQLIAVSDNLEQFDVPTNNAKRFLEQLEPTNNCRICLTHYPELFKEKLLNRGIDIAFTGHAHGGLIRVPHFGGLYSTGEGFLPEFTAGVVKTADDAQVVVSRGLGSHSIFPRINNQPELVVADICWY